MILASLELAERVEAAAYPARFQVKARAKGLPVSNCRSLGPPSAAPGWNGLHQHPRHYLGSETWDS